MRIALVSDNYPTLAGDVGGIGTYSRTVAEQLVQLGHEVHVFAFTGSQGIFAHGGVVVHGLKHWNGRRVMGLRAALEFTWRHSNAADRLDLFRMHDAVRKVAKRRPFDVIEVPEFAGIGRAIVADRRLAHLMAVRLHGSRMQHAGPLWRAGLDDPELGTVRHADVLTAPTAAAAARTEQILGQRLKATVVGNPVTWRAQPRHPRTGPDVLFFGRLEYGKGVDILAQAFGLLPGVTSAFAGADASWPDGRLGSQIIRASAPEAQLLGRLTHEEVLQLASRARVVVVPSRWESFGMTLVEAMMAGAPVIASDIAPFRELTADGGVAQLVPLDDPHAMAAAIRRMLDDQVYAEALGDDGYRHAQQWRVESVVDQLLAAWVKG